MTSITNRPFFPQPQAFSGKQPSPQISFGENPLNKPIVKQMTDLIEIPSATPMPGSDHEQAVEEQLTKVRALIVEKFQALGVDDIEITPQKGIIIRIAGTGAYQNVKPLLLMAHYDIVAGDIENPTRGIVHQLSRTGNQYWLGTDGTTTLGADNKGGIAAILDTVARLKGKHPEQQTPIEHPPLEVVLSPDEESTCDSVRQLDTSRLRAQKVLVLDSFDAKHITTGLASAVPIIINLKGLPVQAGSQINSIPEVMDLIKQLGSGVILMDKQFSTRIPVISKNLSIIKTTPSLAQITHQATAPENAQPFSFTLSGLQGGHSGMDITKKRDNAILIAQHLTQMISKNPQVHLTNINGGEGIPAIPKAFILTGYLTPGSVALPELKKNLETAAAAITKLHRVAEPKLDLKLDFPTSVESNDIPKYYQPPSELVLKGLLRSASPQEQEKELARIHGLVKAFETRLKALDNGIQVSIDTPEFYPSWQNMFKEFIPTLLRAAQKVGFKHVKIEKLHGAAQCSIMGNHKNADGEPFDSLLIGPHIVDAHSPKERINLRTLEQLGQWLLGIVLEYAKTA